ncbi:MAG TPA: patatin-like phospholipase family protein, partial [Flavobacteriales bacterium]|nr:patatin-like phospholipase family protein [Flavobacteriales bacterium]
MSDQDPRTKDDILYTTKDDVVIAQERRHLGLGDPSGTTGLSISGGGIRSASFGLGVMQALVGNNVLERMDYMSTVSGGGYLGSALTWALHQGKGKAGTTPENFPLGHKEKHRDKDALLSKNEVETKDQDNDLLDYIRQHGNYLTPTSKLGMLSFIPVVLRSMTISLLVYLGFFSVAMTLLVWVLYNGTAALLDSVGSDRRPEGVLLVIGGVLVISLLATAIPFSVSTYTRFGRTARYRYKVALDHQRVAGILLKLALTCLVLGTLPIVVHLLKGRLYVPGGSTLFGSAVGVWQYLKAHKKEASTGTKTDLIVYAGAFALFYGILLFAYMLATIYFLDHCTYDFAHPGVFAIAILLTLALGYLTNLNLIGP